MLRAAVIGVGFVGPHHADAIRRTGYVWTPLVEAALDFARSLLGIGTEASRQIPAS
jgi:predicted dehydrogenase